MKKVLNHFAIGFTALAMVFALGGCLSSGKDDSSVSNVPAPPVSNSAPTISGTPSSSALTDEQYLFTPTASDVDNDTLTFALSGEPDWLTINSSNGALTGTPTLADIGTYPRIVVSVSDGSLSASLPQFTVDVVHNAPPVSNSAPTISGTPSSSALIDEQYSFTPTASDVDNDTLTFAVSGEPDWLTINSSNGALTGTPTLADIGTYPGIVVSVSDDSLSASLPQFTIDVVQNAPPVSNSAPTISGTPSSSALIDEKYSFTPTASDVDNDTLTFDVSGEPDWLTINSSNGALTGKPTLADIGTYPGIVVSVSDGSLSASLPQFTVDVVQNAGGSITLSWIPPTQNEDGTDVELAAYKFYYGTAPGSYSNQIRVDSPGINMYVLENLTPATYYVVATAISTDGAESAFSNEASKQVL